MTVTVEFNVHAYERAHGRWPRNTERGTWVFQEITGFREGEPVFVPGPRSLAAAKRYIVEMVAAEGETGRNRREFRVCP
ncbi:MULTISPECIES: hypothetical protein [unclassified Thioalkalivibrio]|uniref:hypothetical protein n=1 Tax=unclassified Thioalkalivibrio TaxID=2621013 RepID=UPI000360E04B|nr:MULTISPECIES: hypothetical protein [unclassified Thioalkalivibrio]